MGKPDGGGHATFSDNISPNLSWSDAPTDTKSFAITIVDYDVPLTDDDVNVDGKSLPPELPRGPFFHWTLIDIPANVTELAEGLHAQGVVVGGKPGPEAAEGTRHGINNYTQFFEGDADLEGEYFGYDGPFPPWNDEVVHNYVFTIYALDVERLPIEGPFDGPTALEVIEDHVIGSGSFIASYSVNQ